MARCQLIHQFLHLGVLARGFFVDAKRPRNGWAGLICLVLLTAFSPSIVNGDGDADSRVDVAEANCDARWPTAVLASMEPTPTATAQAERPTNASSNDGQPLPEPGNVGSDCLPKPINGTHATAGDRGCHDCRDFQTLVELNVRLQI